MNHREKLERPGVLIENGHVVAETLAVLDVAKDLQRGNDGHGSEIIVLPLDGAALERDLQAGSVSALREPEKTRTNSGTFRKFPSPNESFRVNWAVIRAVAIFLLLPAVASIARAETVLLQSGEKIVGKISHQNEREIEMQVPISATIFDTRTIARSEIVEIERPDPSTAAFNALNALAQQPNSLPSQDYDVVQKKLIGFLTEFPQSPHLAEMKQLIGNIDAEKQRVISGERKVGGEWFTPLELQADQEQISATLQYQDFLTAADRDLVQALNIFAHLEKTYPGARTLPDAIDKARELVVRLQQIAQGNLQTLPERKAAREVGWELAGEPERSRLKASAAAEEKAVKDKIAEAKKGGDVWMPLFPNHQVSLEAILLTAGMESKRLASISTTPMRRSLQASLQGREWLKGGNLNGAQTAFAQSASLWPANLMNQQNAALLAEARKPRPTPRPAATPYQ